MERVIVFPVEESDQHVHRVEFIVIHCCLSFFLSKFHFRPSRNQIRIPPCTCQTQAFLLHLAFPLGPHQRRCFLGKVRQKACTGLFFLKCWAALTMHNGCLHCLALPTTLLTLISIPIFRTRIWKRSSMLSINFFANGFLSTFSFSHSWQKEDSVVARCTTR